jgi:hypothetical protein
MAKRDFGIGCSTQTKSKPSYRSHHAARGMTKPEDSVQEKTMTLQTNRSKPVMGAMALWAVLIVLSPLTHAKGDPPFEKLPLVLPAEDFVEPALMAGDGYKIDQHVTNDGFLNTYTLSSDYGPQTVEGTDQLLARIQEIKATQAIEALERSDAFKDAVKGGVTGIWEGGKALVSAPVETTKGAAKGLGRWLGNVGKSITSDDPNQENVLSTALGYDAIKRAYALEFGVDPYTDFEPLQERLGEIARSSAAGGLVTSAALSSVSEGTLSGTIITVTDIAGLKELLKDNPPATLDKINRKKLIEMGIPSYQADAFLRNYHYSPTDKTLLVAALGTMGATEGREVFLAHATAAPDPAVARFMQQRAEMLASYINNVQQGKIVDIGGYPWLVGRNGVVLGTLPVDYLAWTPDIAAGAKMIEEYASNQRGITGQELLVEGRVSPTTRRALEDHGWKVQDKVYLVSKKPVKKSGSTGVSPGVKGGVRMVPTP